MGYIPFIVYFYLNIKTNRKMTNLHKKSLEHVSETLKSFDTYAVYNALIQAMTEAGIDNETRTKIANKHQKALSEQIKKIRSSEQWIDAFILDLNLNN